MKGRMLNDNKGFSLLELIVAVLIIGIISSAAVVTMTSIFGAQVTSAARVVVDSMKQTRTKAMGLANASPGAADSVVYAKFYKNTSKDIYVDICVLEGATEKVLNTQKICNSSLKLIFGTAADTSDNITAKAIVGDTSSDGVKIFFRKDTGGISKVETVAGVTLSDCVTLRIQNPSNEKIDIIMVTLTGRCYADEQEG